MDGLVGMGDAVGSLATIYAESSVGLRPLPRVDKVVAAPVDKQSDVETIGRRAAGVSYVVGSLSLHHCSFG
jgi:hypothetical protein